MKFKYSTKSAQFYFGCFLYKLVVYLFIISQYFVVPLYTCSSPHLRVTLTLPSSNSLPLKPCVMTGVH